MKKKYLLLTTFFVFSSLAFASHIVDSLDESSSPAQSAETSPHRLTLAEQVLAVLGALSDVGENTAAHDLRQHLKNAKVITTADRSLQPGRIQILLDVISLLKEATGVQKVSELSVETIYRHYIISLIASRAILADEPDVNGASYFGHAQHFFDRVIIQRRQSILWKTFNEGLVDYITPEHVVAILSSKKEARPGLVWIPPLIQQVAARQGKPVSPEVKSTFTSNDIVLAVLATERLVGEIPSHIEKVERIAEVLKSPGIQIDIKPDLIANVLAARARQPERLVLYKLAEEFEMLMIQEAKIELLKTNIAPNISGICGKLAEFGFFDNSSYAQPNSALAERVWLLTEHRKPLLTPLQQVKAVLAARSFFHVSEESGVPGVRLVRTPIAVAQDIHGALCQESIKLLGVDAGALYPALLNRIVRILELEAMTAETPEVILAQLQMEDVLIARSAVQKLTRREPSIKAMRNWLIRENFVRESDMSTTDVVNILEQAGRANLNVAIVTEIARSQLDLLDLSETPRVRVREAMKAIVNPNGTMSSILNISVGDEAMQAGAQSAARYTGVAHEQRVAEVKAEEGSQDGKPEEFRAKKLMKEARGRHGGPKR